MDGEDALIYLCVMVILLVVTALVAAANGMQSGRNQLANEIADGTHIVEVREFSDGTREVRIVEVDDE